MRLLVTGGAGFIGNNFIRYWLKKYPKDNIVNLDLLTYSGNLESLRDVENNPNYKFIRGDVRKSKDVEKAMRGVDIVVHFAAESHVDRALFAASEFVKTNVLGTQILCEIASKNKVKRLHYIGTDEVFGALPLHSKKKFTEKTKFDPRNQYAASKAAAEHMVRAYYHTNNLPVTITNCTNNFGPYQHPEKLIPLFITNLLEDKKVPMYGDGLYVRDWLYVDDHARAIDLVLKKGKVGETYMVGALHKEISNLELTYKILKLLGKDESYIEHVKDRPGHDRRYAVDWSKIRKLGWKPQHDMDTWLVKTVQWYKENKKWWKRIKSGEYRKYYRKVYQERK
jgi:dTDP-glucose 4,6-dehydratase